jgi:FAD synthetase
VFLDVRLTTPLLSRITSLSLSYNGGKDCLVLLILYLAALSTHPNLPSQLESIYIVPPHPFPEIDTFVLSSSSTYHLSNTRLSRESMKAAFADYLTLKPQIQAIFVGTRRTDPHGANLTSFDMTDHGWPPFMRVHPVIDWHYVEIWEFIRHLGIEYCELYDRGYTSLGGTTDTHPNPALKVGEEDFKPAYELEGDEEERLGRDR